MKTLKHLCLLLTLTLLAGSIPILYKVAGLTGPRIYVDPAVNEYFTGTTAVGATFNVSIKAADWVAPIRSVFSYSFLLKYDTTMLEAVGADVPPGHWLTPIIKSTNVFIVDSGTIDLALGTVSFAATLMNPEPGANGTGTIATVTLKITKAPASGQALTSSLLLQDVTLMNTDADTIPAASYSLVPATFRFLPPPPSWYLKIEPSLSLATAAGEAVNINVSFYGAKADAKIIGVQFRVVYPAVLMATVDNVFEGPFFKSFGNTAFTAFVEQDSQGNQYVIVGLLLLPSGPGIGEYNKTVEGNGTLATITFKVTAVPAKVTTYPLTLTEVIIVDKDVNSLGYHHLGDGAIQVPAKREDINGDGKVNIEDMTIFAVAFGSDPTKPKWNAKADINKDDKINIMDGVLIAKSFGFQA